MPQDKKLTLVEHLEELRHRIIKSLIFLSICAIIAYSYIDKIFPFLLKPIGKAVFISPEEAFITNIKIAFWLGLLVSSPFILYQIWKFISVALNLHERRYIFFFGPLSFMLFLSGFAFGYLVIIPIGIRLLLQSGSELVTPLISIGKYVSFIAGLSFAFGLVFQLPIALLFLTKIGFITPSILTKRWREAIVLIFITAGILTPPDVISQLLMALPLILLYILGVLLSKFASRRPL